jgi:hypothetical protein
MEAEAAGFRAARKTGTVGIVLLVSDSAQPSEPKHAMI